MIPRMMGRRFRLEVQGMLLLLLSLLPLLLLWMLFLGNVFVATYAPRHPFQALQITLEGCCIPLLEHCREGSGRRDGGRSRTGTPPPLTTTTTSTRGGQKIPEFVSELDR